jgi:hypothetical protein
LPFLLGLLSGIYFISFNVIGVSFTHYPGDLIDARFNNYLLEHAHLFFSGKLDSFWSAPFMFPEKNVISYSDNLLGSAPFYSLFRFLGCDRETAFQAWYLFVCFLNYSACYLFLYVVFRNHYSAVIGAFIFAFSMALQAQLGHAQTFARYPIPLTFLMAYLYLKELKPVYFFAAILFLVYQIYCGIYIGFMLIIPVALFFVLSIYFKWGVYKTKFKKARWYLLMLLGLLVNVLILLPLMLPYLERAKALGLYSYEYVSKSLLTPLSYFFSWKGSLIWDFISGIGTHYEWYTNFQIFPGAVATLCVIGFGVIYIYKNWISKNSFPLFEFTPNTLLFFWMGVFTFLFFVRFGDTSLYKIIFLLPGYGSLRALQRIITVELFFYAIATAFLLSYFFRKKNTKTRILFLLCLVLVICDNYVKEDYIHRHEKADTKSRVNLLMTKLKHVPKHAVVSYEPDSLYSSVNDYHLDAMLATQSLDLISLNGYSANSPNGFDVFWVKPNEANRLFWLKTKGIPSQKIYPIK